MDEDYDIEDDSLDAGAPTVRSAASSGSLSPPPMLAPPPGANAEQRRMVDMMNNRAMQMYRQVLMDRRSSENRQAIMDRQEAGRAFRARQSDLAAQRVQDRMDQRAVYESDRRDQTERSRIAAEERRAHEQRLKNDPDYRRSVEMLQADATAGEERNASRRDLLSALPQQPGDRYAGALPLQGGGLRNPVTAMQMPEGLATAMPADPRAVEGAIDLSLKREFAAGPGAARVRQEATGKSANEIDVSDRRRTDRLLDSTARAVPQRRAFSGDPAERYETYKTALDDIIKAGKPEEKTGKVDVAAIPKVEDGMRDRMVSVIDQLGVTNDMFPKDLARAVYDIVLVPTVTPKLVRTDNGVFVETEGGSRLALTADTYRQLMLLRGQTQKKFEEGKKAAETKKSTDAAIRRQAIDDADEIAPGSPAFNRSVDAMNRNRVRPYGVGPLGFGQR